MKIPEIKYLRNFIFYIDCNSKTSRFGKLSTCKNGSNFQIAKLSLRKIKVFYSKQKKKKKQQVFLSLSLSLSFTALYK